MCKVSGSGLSKRSNTCSTTLFSISLRKRVGTYASTGLLEAQRGMPALKANAKEHKERKSRDPAGEFESGAVLAYYDRITVWISTRSGRFCKTLAAKGRGSVRWNTGA